MCKTLKIEKKDFEIVDEKEEIKNFMIDEDKFNTKNMKDIITNIIDNNKTKTYIEKDKKGDIKYAWLYNINEKWVFINFHRTSPEYRNITTTKNVIHKILSILEEEEKDNVQFEASTNDKKLIKMYNQIYKLDKKNWRKNKTELTSYKITKETLQNLNKKFDKSWK